MGNWLKKKRLAVALARNKDRWVKGCDLASEARLSTRVIGGLMRPLTFRGVVERRLLMRHSLVSVCVSEYLCHEGDVAVLLEGLNGHTGVLEPSKAWYGERLIGE